MEQRVRQGPASELPELLPADCLSELSQLMSASVEQLAVLTEPDRSEPARDHLTEAAFKQHLEAILPLLQSNNLRGVTMIEALRDYQLPCAVPIWTQLNDHLLSLDFKAAAGIVQDLLQA
ncbi:hypothetical protein ACVW0A_004967 [Pseudomonas sp. TE3610]